MGLIFSILLAPIKSGETVAPPFLLPVVCIVTMDIIVVIKCIVTFLNCNSQLRLFYNTLLGAFAQCTSQHVEVP